MTIWSYIRIWANLFTYESALPIHINVPASIKGTYPFLGPRKREPTRILMTSSALVFRTKTACPRALPKGRPSLEMPPCEAASHSLS